MKRVSANNCLDTINSGDERVWRVLVGEGARGLKIRGSVTAVIEFSTLNA
jgi:hypothetical protein